MGQLTNTELVETVADALDSQLPGTGTHLGDDSALDYRYQAAGSLRPTGMTVDIAGWQEPFLKPRQSLLQLFETAVTGHQPVVAVPSGVHERSVQDVCQSIEGQAQTHYAYLHKVLAVDWDSKPTTDPVADIHQSIHRSSTDGDAGGGAVAEPPTAASTADSLPASLDGEFQSADVPTLRVTISDRLTETTYLILTDDGRVVQWNPLADELTAVEDLSG
jgi:hypothetical protein